jgi:2'-phosphotransferase
VVRLAPFDPLTTIRALIEPSAPAGMRTNCDLFIFLDVAQLLAGEFWRSLISTLLGHSSLILERHPADGIAIYTSTNNVVLTAGIDGVVPPKYFAKVVKKDGQVLVPPTDA